MPKLSINPWFSMWIKPRETIRALASQDTGYRFWILSLIVGWPFILQIYVILYYENPIYLLLITITLGILFGALNILIQTAILFLTGKMLKGKASFAEMRLAISWAHLPFILFSLGFIVLFLLNWFLPTLETGESLLHPAIGRMFLIPLCALVGFVAYLILLIGSVAEVQKFSIARSLVNVLLAPIVLYVLVLLLFIVSNYLLL